MKIWYLVAALVPAFASGGVVADLQNDWSTSVNGPNGWSYNAGSVPLSPVAGWNGSVVAAWATGQTTTPAMLKIPSGIQTPLDVLPNDILIASTDPTNGPGSGVANVTWTSTVSGLVTISGTVWNADLTNAFDNVYTLKVKGSVLTTGTVVHIVNRRALAVPFSQTVQLSVGDVVEFDIAKPPTQTIGTFAGLSMTITATQLTKVLPQFAYGGDASGSWYSAFYFTSISANDSSFTVNFFNDDGTPKNVPALGGTSTTVNLPSRGTVLLEANDTPPQTTEGYMTAALPDGVSGFAIFRQSVAGRLDQEAMVPYSGGTRTSTLIFDDTNLTTTIQIVNLSSNPTTLTVTARGPGAGIIGTSQPITIPANGKFIGILRQIPGIEGITGRRGSVDFSVNSGAIAVLGLRFGGTAFTGIPSIDH